jgi:hypothetical protein
MISGIIAYCFFIDKAIKHGYKSDLGVSLTINDNIYTIKMLCPDKANDMIKIMSYVKQLNVTHKPLFNYKSGSNHSNYTFNKQHIPWYKYDICKVTYLGFRVKMMDVYICNIQKTLCDLLIDYIFYGNKFALDCYYDLIKALNYIELSFQIGELTWPLDSLNESESTEYWNSIHSANINERKRLKTITPNYLDMTELISIQQLRPPGLFYGYANYENTKKKFLEWDIEASPFFNVDGSKL